MISPRCHSIRVSFGLFCILMLGTTGAEAQTSDQVEAEKQRADNYRDAYELLKSFVGAEKYTAKELEAARRRLKENDRKLAAEVQAIEHRFQENMKLFPAGYRENKNYATLPGVLWQIIKDLNVELLDANKRIRDLNVQLAAAEEGARRGPFRIRDRFF